MLATDVLDCIFEHRQFQRPSLQFGYSMPGQGLVNRQRVEDVDQVPVIRKQCAESSIVAQRRPCLR
jgi:hypothetical protein